MLPLFHNRSDAGKKLAEKLKDYKDKNIFIFAIPRGGVPVAYEVAKFLKAPMDVIVARKLHIPWNPEAGFGAVAPDGTMVLNESMVAELGIGEKVIQEVKKEVLDEIKRREKIFRGEKSFPEVKNKIVLVIDDGLASGYTMIAAIKFLQKKKSAKIIVAVPTSSQSAYSEVKQLADETISLYIQKGYPFAVASFYQEWYDLTDDEVMDYLIWARFAIEPRHESWFNKKIYQILKKHNVALCIADSPVFPTAEVVTADFVYIRFHGGKILYGSRYSEKEMQKWAKKIKKWTKKRFDVYAYFNNDAFGYAVKNAKELKKLLNC